MKNIILYILVLTSYQLFSQNTPDTVDIYRKQSQTSTYSFNKDTTRGSFEIFRKGYVKKNTKKMDGSHKKNLEELKKNPPKPNQAALSVIRESFYYWNKTKPEKLKNLKNIPFITRKEFVTNKQKYQGAKNLFIIHDTENGEYLIWKVEHVPVE